MREKEPNPFLGADQGGESESAHEKNWSGSMKAMKEVYPDVERVEAILKIPRDQWVEEEQGLGVFNNYGFKLPGGKHFENWKKDTDSRVFNKRGYNRHSLMGNKTAREFAANIEQALKDTGVNVSELAGKNVQIQELARQVSDIVHENENGWRAPEAKKVLRELSRITNEIHYDAAPAALKLISMGYTPGDLFG